jgi:hypothetical protein
MLLLAVYFAAGAEIQSPERKPAGQDSIFLISGSDINEEGISESQLLSNQSTSFQFSFHKYKKTPGSALLSTQPSHTYDFIVPSEAEPGYSSIIPLYLLNRTLLI